MRRPWDMALVLLLAAVAAGQSALILTDLQPLMFDPLTNLLPAVTLRQAMEAGSSEAWRLWLTLTDFRPPLPSVIYQPLIHLLDDQIRAVRFTDLAIFLWVIWQIALLGRRLSGPAAGFVAASLFALFPLTLGWSIMGNADPLIWAVLLLLFRVLLGLDLSSPWQAVALGLSVGLCTATRLLCLVFLVAPFAWVLAVKVRSLRALGGLCLAAAAALGVAGWWYLSQFRAVLDNVVMSSETQVERSQAEFHPVNYLADGYWLVLAGLAAAGWVIWRRGLLPRQLGWLLAGWVALPALQLSLIWDYWARYPLAALPQCALLAGIAVDRGTEAWPRGRRAAALAAALLLGAAPLAAYQAGARSMLPGAAFSTTAGEPAPLASLRYRSGLLRPDTRPHDALFRVLAPLQPGAALVVVSELTMTDYPFGIMNARRRPPYRLFHLPDQDMPYAKPKVGEVRYLLTVRPECARELPEQYLCSQYAPSPWLAEADEAKRSRLLAEARDPSGAVFRLYQLKEPI